MEVDNTNSQVQELDPLASSGGYNQVIHKSSNVLNNSMLCIDFISAISNHEVDVSTFDKCHYNIIYGKISIRVPLPSIYGQEVQDYKKPILKILKNQFNIN